MIQNQKIKKIKKDENEGESEGEGGTSEDDVYYCYSDNPEEDKSTSGRL